MLGLKGARYQGSKVKIWSCRGSGESCDAAVGTEDGLGVGPAIEDAHDV